MTKRGWFILALIIGIVLAMVIVFGSCFSGGTGSGQATATPVKATPTVLSASPTPTAVIVLPTQTPASSDLTSSVSTPASSVLIPVLPIEISEIRGAYIEWANNIKDPKGKITVEHSVAGEPYQCCGAVAIRARVKNVFTQPLAASFELYLLPTAGTGNVAVESYLWQASSRVTTPFMNPGETKTIEFWRYPAARAKEVLGYQIFLRYLIFDSNDAKINAEVPAPSDELGSIEGIYQEHPSAQNEKFSVAYYGARLRSGQQEARVTVWFSAKKPMSYFYTYITWLDAEGRPLVTHRKFVGGMNPVASFNFAGANSYMFWAELPINK